MCSRPVALARCGIVWVTRPNMSFFAHLHKVAAFTQGDSKSQGIEKCNTIIVHYGDSHKWRRTRRKRGDQAGVTMCDVGGWGRVKCCDVTQGTLATAGFSSITDTACTVGLYGAEPMTWCRVCPSVCHIMRPQPRRAAGWRLSAVRTPSAAMLHWSQHGQCEQCHVHSSLRLESWSQTCFCRQ